VDLDNEPNEAYCKLSKLSGPSKVGVIAGQGSIWSGGPWLPALPKELQGKT